MGASATPPLYRTWYKKQDHLSKMHRIFCNTSYPLSFRFSLSLYFSHRCNFCQSYYDKIRGLLPEKCEADLEIFIFTSAVQTAAEYPETGFLKCRTGNPFPRFRDRRTACLKSPPLPASPPGYDTSPHHIRSSGTDCDSPNWWCPRWQWYHRRQRFWSG